MDFLPTLYNIIDDVCSPIFKRNVNIFTSSSSAKTYTKKQEWYDSECKGKQKEFYKYLNS